MSITIAASIMAGGGVALAGEPFRVAALAPDDVGLFVHVDDAADLRGQLQDRPIGRWVRSWLAQGELPEAWQRLAESAGMGEAELFDTCLGREVTVLSRDGEAGAEWVVLTRIEPRASSALLRALAPGVLAPRGDVAVFHLAGQELLLARRDDRMLIAPDDSRGLFDAMVSSLGAEPVKSLAGHAAVKRGIELGPARAGVLVRHPLPLGGWSVGVASLDGDRLTVRHASRFENAPFRSRITELAWSPAPLRCLDGTGFLGFIEPTDTAGGPFDAFLSTLLGEPLMSQALGDNLGPRRITAVSDIEGRLQEPAFDLLLPTIVRAYEVNDPARARSQLDEHMVRLVAALNRLGEGAFELDVPDPAAFVPGRPRRVPIGPLARWLFGDVDGIDRATLCWTVGGAGDRWCIVATSPDHLDAVTRALADESRCGDPAGGGEGRWTTCGVADGRRLAQHLAGWSTHAEALAAPDDVEAMREALILLRELAQGIDHCRWRVARPTAETMRTEAEIELSPPDSAEK